MAHAIATDGTTAARKGLLLVLHGYGQQPVSHHLVSVGKVGHSEARLMWTKPCGMCFESSWPWTLRTSIRG